jgi:putative spermidine/putrescine transport system permease protein
MSFVRRAWLAATFAFLFAPMVTLAVYSFYEDSYLTFPPKGWTLKWYPWVFTRPEFVNSLRESFALGAGATLIAALIGVPAAIALVRGRFRGRNAVDALVLSPLMLPTVILGVALLIFFSAMHVRPNFWTLLIGHVVVITPFVILNVRVSLVGVPANLEEAARGLGATPVRVFVRVVLPMIMPGVVAGALLAFLISFDELAMTIFLTPPTLVTLPVKIFTYVEWSLDPGIAALATVLMAFTTALLMVIDRVRGAEHLF